jgi:hypothetical protein
MNAPRSMQPKLLGVFDYAIYLTEGINDQVIINHLP